MTGIEYENALEYLDKLVENCNIDNVKIVYEALLELGANEEWALQQLCNVED